MDEKNAVVAIFSSHTEAEAAVKELQKSGFDMKQLSIVGKDCLRRAERPRGRPIQHRHPEEQHHHLRDRPQVRQVSRDRARHRRRGAEGQEHPRADRPRGTRRASRLTRFGQR